MARPKRTGFDYFPLDTGFFEDIKVKKIGKRCGIVAQLTILYVYCLIYRDKGYYLKCDEDTAFFISEVMGISEAETIHILDEAVKVGLFDPAMYRYNSVLTSRGIQSRYLRMRRDSNRYEADITLYRVNPDGVFGEKTGVFSDTLPEYASSLPENANTLPENADTLPEYATKESKGNKRKGNERKEKEGVRKRRSPKFTPPTLDEVRAYVHEKGYLVDPDFFFSYFTEGDWKDKNGDAVKNWKQKLISWNKREIAHRERGGSRRGNGKDNYKTRNEAIDAIDWDQEPNEWIN